LRKRSEEFGSQIAKLQEQIEIEKLSEAQLKKRLSGLQAEKGELTKSIENLKSTYNALLGDLRGNLESREASIRECKDRLSISFVNRVVFGSAMARLSPDGKEVLRKAGDILKQYKEGKIRIVGHSDNIPITPGFRRRYPTNWELSVARASAVVRFFQDAIGISPQRMEIIGRSYFQPIADNSTKEGRAKNRRVEIIVAPTFASAQTIPQ
jgi:flagellar motor protein MotB